MENELKILKTVLKAELTKKELKTVVLLLNTKEKTVSTSYSELALAVGLTHSNLLRAIKSLEEKNIIGKRKNGLYVKSLRSWKAPK